MFVLLLLLYGLGEFTCFIVLFASAGLGCLLDVDYCVVLNLLARWNAFDNSVAYWSLFVWSFRCFYCLCLSLDCVCCAVVICVCFAVSTLVDYLGWFDGGCFVV